MLEGAEEISVEFIRDVMDATHFEGELHTLYTTVYDLNEGLVYLYYFHDYENVVVIDLAEELAQGPYGYLISSLFPDNIIAEAWSSSLLFRAESIIAANLDDTVDPAIFDRY